MKRNAFLAGAIAAITIGVSMAGCDSHPVTAGEGQPTATRHDSDGRGHFAGSLTKDYRSLTALRNDSVTVVEVVATTDQQVGSAAQNGSSPVRATDTKMIVEAVLYGKNPGAHITVHQWGSRMQTSPDVPSAVVPGHSYVLFLTDFEFSHGHPTGKYALTGGVGQYAVSGTMLTLAPSAAEGLPASLSMSRLKEVLAA